MHAVEAPALPPPDSASGFCHSSCACATCISRQPLACAGCSTGWFDLDVRVW